MGKKIKEKFQFGLDFQEGILHFVIANKQIGYKVLELIEDSYFTTIPCQIIAYVLKRFYKKRRRIPGRSATNEQFRDLYSGKLGLSADLLNSLDREERQNIDNLLTKFYTQPLLDGDEIMEKVVEFCRYINLKDAIEGNNLLDFASYDKFSKKIQKAITIGNNLDGDDGVFLINGYQERAWHRDEAEKPPTPFKQMNLHLNGGGLNPGSLIVILAEAKRFKTGILINIAKGYLKMKKKVLYLDYENGQKALATRGEQSIIHTTQSDLINGTVEPKLAKMIRKYRRLGAELVIKRMPAYTTTSNDLQAYVDKIYLKYGLKFDVVICDYADLQGASSGENEKEDKRISDAYIDLKNFAEHNKYEAIYTASHVKREAAKRRGTKYEQNDVAKAIDKVRHADAIWGLQESEEEIENGVMRIEIIDQRDGERDGKVLLWVDIAKQTVREFNKDERKEYYEQMGMTSEGKKRKAEKQSDL